MDLLTIVFLISFGYIVYYVIRLLIKQRLTEAFISNVEQNPMQFKDEAYQPDTKFNWHDDHYFLMQSISPGKEAIVKLRESNPFKSDYYYLSAKDTLVENPDPYAETHNPSKLSYPRMKDKLTCIPENAPIRELIKHYQPYMYNEAEIINYYNYPFYRDWRFGEQPIDIRFIADPKGYCEKYPMAYPCPKYYSKW